jgi:hypothetical protein
MLAAGDGNRIYWDARERMLESPESRRAVGGGWRNLICSWK